MLQIAGRITAEERLKLAQHKNVVQQKRPVEYAQCQLC